MGSKKIVNFCNGVCPWAMQRVKEANTWRGLAILGTAFGVFNNPGQAHLIMGTVATIFGAVDIVTPENKE